MLTLTNAGLRLLDTVIAGGSTLNFTNIRLGDGGQADVSGASPALSHVRNTLEITGAVVQDTAVVITGAFSNAGVTSGYRATEIGVYAEDPADNTAEILYAYQYTDPSVAEYISAPAQGGQPTETTFDVAVYIGEDTTVNVYISEDAAVTPEMLAAHTGNHNNPHQVTAEQLGLGNVPNVDTNDQTPTYEEAAALSELTSGETLAAAFGKIKKAIKALIDHLADNVRHVTAEERARWDSAGSAAHTHSASDITTGVLPEARGGTGVANHGTFAKNIQKYIFLHKLEPTGSSVDDMVEPGIHHVTGLTINGFSMAKALVLTIGGDSVSTGDRYQIAMCVQRTFPEAGDTTGYDPRMYVRCGMANAVQRWGDWRTVTMEAVS